MEQVKGASETETRRNDTETAFASCSFALYIRILVCGFYLKHRAHRTRPKPLDRWTTEIAIISGCSFAGSLLRPPPLAVPLYFHFLIRRIFKHYLSSLGNERFENLQFVRKILFASSLFADHADKGHERSRGSKDKGRRREEKSRGGSDLSL